MGRPTGRRIVSETQRVVTPYSQGVTDYRPPSSIDLGLVREIAAIALLMIGLIGLLILAWFIDWRAGAALTCAYSIAGGVALGWDR